MKLYSTPWGIWNLAAAKLIGFIRKQNRFRDPNTIQTGVRGLYEQMSITNTVEDDIYDCNIEFYKDIYHNRVLDIKVLLSMLITT